MGTLSGCNIKTTELATAKKTISVSLIGGLGNWMFMIGAGLTIADRTGRNFVMRPYMVQGYHHDMKLHCDKIQSFFVTRESEPVCIIKENAAGETCESIVHRISTKDDDHVVILGFFQRPEFLHTFLHNIIPPSVELPHYFIHVRRGDYVGLNLLLPLIYYEKSMKFFSGVPLIFSNDPHWCQEQVIFKGGIISSTRNSLQILAEMKSCQGGICANSSLSYIGAWLQNRTHRICMPGRWFSEDVSHNRPSWATIIHFNKTAALV